MTYPAHFFHPVLPWVLQLLSKQGLTENVNPCLLPSAWFGQYLFDSAESRVGFLRSECTASLSLKQAFTVYQTHSTSCPPWRGRFKQPERAGVIYTGSRFQSSKNPICILRLDKLKGIEGILIAHLYFCFLRCFFVALAVFYQSLAKGEHSESLPKYPLKPTLSWTHERPHYSLPCKLIFITLMTTLPLYLLITEEIKTFQSKLELQLQLYFKNYDWMQIKREDF